jgi:hypothetical protein
MQLGAIAGVGIGTDDTFWVRFSAWIWDLFVSNAPTTTSVMAPRPFAALRPRTRHSQSATSENHKQLLALCDQTGHTGQGEPS